MESLECDLLRHIGTLSRCIHSIMDEKFKAYGFQRGQFIFFTRICETPGLTLTDLTLQCAVDKATTTKAVDKLAAAGYVENGATAGMAGHGTYTLRKRDWLYTMRLLPKKTGRLRPVWPD